MKLPCVATREQWLQARTDLLRKEKDLTKQRDALIHRRAASCRWSRSRRTTGSRVPRARSALLDLFEGRRQLIIYHFMFDPEWDEGCPSCTAGTDEISDGLLEHLHTRDTTTPVSRAPLEKLVA